MSIGGRSVRTLAKSMIQPRHYVAARNMVSLYYAPVDMSRRYLTNGGTYPHTVRVRTPSGPIELETYSPDDVLTVNEIFCREDYKADAGDEIVVDFGSNIGISAAYFLSRGPKTFTYLFEPLPINVERLRHNLRRFPDRYLLHEAAIAIEEGQVEFGWESSGRYGGVGVATGNSITVASLSSRSVIEDIVGRHGRIDVLKIDIEGLEEAVLDDLPESLLAKIGKIYVEWYFIGNNPLAATHRLRQYGAIGQFLPNASS